MRWLEAAALAGFAVLLGASALLLKRGEVRRGSPRALAAWLVVGVIVLVVGVYLVGSTW